MYTVMGYKSYAAFFFVLQMLIGLCKREREKQRGREEETKRDRETKRPRRETKDSYCLLLLFLSDIMLNLFIALLIGNYELEDEQISDETPSSWDGKREQKMRERRERESENRGKKEERGRRDKREAEHRKRREKKSNRTGAKERGYKNMIERERDKERKTKTRGKNLTRSLRNL